MAGLEISAAAAVDMLRRLVALFIIQPVVNFLVLPCEGRIACALLPFDEPAIVIRSKRVDRLAALVEMARRVTLFDTRRVAARESIILSLMNDQ